MSPFSLGPKLPGQSPNYTFDSITEGLRALLPLGVLALSSMGRKHLLSKLEITMNFSSGNIFHIKSMD